MIDDPTTRDTALVTAQTPAPEPSEAERKAAAKWRARIDRCRTKRRSLVKDWALNVDYRRGKGHEEDADSQRSPIPVDWSQTKAKHAQLFSQVPEIRATAMHPLLLPLAWPFARKLNNELKRAGIASAMNEVLPDCINAAGIAAVIVGYETRSVEKEVPAIDLSLLPPEFQAQAMAEIQKTPELLRTVSDVIDSRFYTRRVSPANLLWPVEFKGSNFDHAPWIGYTGRMTWAEAQQSFPTLTPEDKTKVVGTYDDYDTKLTDDVRDLDKEDDVVEFDEIYYWAHLYDTDCKSFCKIRRMVFVHGKTDPLVTEDWKGQQVAADGRTYLGAKKFPVRVLTLTYISDEAIPPSDTAISRPQVLELIRSRGQYFAQRDHNKPMRWYDVNRIDPMIGDLLARGEWQEMIPTNGDGSRVIGEVARAQFPHDDHAIEQQIRTDLKEAWQIGSNQMGAEMSGEKSASEAQIIQQNFSTRIGYERAQVTAFFLGIAEVLAGLVTLYGDFETPDIGPESQQKFRQWDRKAIPTDFLFSIRPDASVLLDSEQRIQRVMRFLNMTAKSGFVNLEPVIQEVASLSGLDPDLVVKPPQPPKGPEPPNVSISVNATDILNPVVLATLFEAGYGPSPKAMQASQALLQSVMHALMNPQPVAPSPGPPPGVPPGLPPGLLAGGPPPATLDQPGPDLAPPPPSEEEQEGYTMLPRINQRRDDGSSS